MAELVYDRMVNSAYEDRLADVRRYSRLLLMSDEGLGELGYDNAQAARNGATIVLADAVADRDIGDAAGQVLVETIRANAPQNRDFFTPEASADDGYSVLDLYAVWGVIRHARASFADAVLPAELITFISYRAEKLGEHAIAFDVLQLRCVDENLEIEDHTLDESLEIKYAAFVTEEHDTKPASLSQIAEHTSRILDEHVAITCAELYLSPNILDKAFIGANSDSFDKLFMALTVTLRILTRTGAVAASALHDQLRLQALGTTSANVRTMLQAKLLLSEVGRKAAATRHDKLFIDEYGNDLPALEKAFRGGMFYTAAGKTEAMRILGIESVQE
ncbi:MAG TPA: hypothetical protein VLG47_06490 [Candidatus Saccharimonadales bacterium]|nr:hypothetical protein [Candidatus Saccharimonadales bacterium]